MRIEIRLILSVFSRDQELIADLLMLFAILSESILDAILRFDMIRSMADASSSTATELQSHGPCCLGIGAHGHLLSHVLDMNTLAVES